MYDPTLANLYTLEPNTRNAAFYLVNAFRQAGVPVIITSARRSYAEQLRHYFAGRSRTLTSRHLSGRAFDVDVAGWNRADIPASFWGVIGPYGEALGLKWGGRWKDPYDPGHFEAP